MSATDLPPAAALTPDNPPPIRAEIEAGAIDSVERVWEKIGGVRDPAERKALWLRDMIPAQRRDRQAWISLQQEGARATKKAKAARVDEIFGVVRSEGEAPPPKRSRASKPSRKKGAVE